VKSYITFYLFCQKWRTLIAEQSRDSKQPKNIHLLSPHCMTNMHKCARFKGTQAWEIIVATLHQSNHAWAWNLSLNKLIWRVDSAKAEDLSRILLHNSEHGQSLRWMSFRVDSLCDGKNHYLTISNTTLSDAFKEGIYTIKGSEKQSEYNIHPHKFF
jgi:hypothetical protein